MEKVEEIETKPAVYVAMLVHRLSGWKSKLLSFGAWIILIQSTLLAIPLFCMQALLPPKGILDEIHRVCMRFLWGSNQVPCTGLAGIHVANQLKKED
jgi:hypothetical protein